MNIVLHKVVCAKHEFVKLLPVAVHSLFQRLFTVIQIIRTKCEHFLVQIQFTFNTICVH